mmetsp:Transcript_36008/g.52558  ORF Transcript_36008/g.52558 Transcript_36008/m.52558 type:complete len:752 (-) Transcript_36008:233-2488(-)
MAAKTQPKGHNLRKRRGKSSTDNDIDPSNSNNKGDNKKCNNTSSNSKKKKSTGIRGQQHRRKNENDDREGIIGKVSRIEVVSRFVVIIIAALLFFVNLRQSNVKDGNNSTHINNYDTNDPILQKAHTFLSNFICQAHQNGHCHPSLQSIPQRRTHMVSGAKPSINSGEDVLILPRRYQIWDLDAMREPMFIQKELFGARHEKTNRTIDSGAFLAAYLVRRYRLARGIWEEEEEGMSRTNNEEGNNIMLDDEDEMLPFFDILPTYQNLSSYHPILWTEDVRTKLLGKHTVSYDLVKAYGDMIESEYDAFATQSTIFASRTTKEEYTTMRINVMSRSFGPGPPGLEEEISLAGDKKSLNEELEHYITHAGVDLSKGCRAMSPILDMYDHHAKPNVEWRYRSDQRAFVVKANRGGIKPNHDVMVSYGKYTDSHLFAKFGFVNGDGSGHTEAKIAVYHQLFDVGLGQQFSYLPNEGISKTTGEIIDPSIKRLRIKDMMRYLQYDDGYDKCIGAPRYTSSSSGEDGDNDDNNRSKGPTEHELAPELKMLKLKYLVRYADDRSIWTLTMPPRNDTSKPAATPQIPIVTSPPKFDTRGGGNFKFDASKVIATCRLIVLTHTDFGGNAIEMLSDALKKNAENNNDEKPFLVGRDTDELEYRALSCLIRFTDLQLSRYPNSIENDMDFLIGESPPAFQSRAWTAAHVRLGEMQTLEALRSISISGAIQMREKIEKKNKQNGDKGGRNPLLIVRNKPCSPQ